MYAIYLFETWQSKIVTDLIYLGLPLFARK